jgi:mannan endo-1,4-beta-mannosidase
MRTFITRYANSSAIMAWELANEPRCGADGVRNLPRSENCTPDLLTSWTDEMSTFVKSIDPNHLVTWGGEGGFNYHNNPDGFYNGYDGGDFDVELDLPNIDFGVFHAYPDWWSKSVEWTVQWIRDHAKSGRSVGKPVVLEEYGEFFPFHFSSIPVSSLWRPETHCGSLNLLTIILRLVNPLQAPRIPRHCSEHFTP